MTEGGIMEIMILNVIKGLILGMILAIIIRRLSETDQKQ